MKPSTRTVARAYGITLVAAILVALCIRTFFWEAYHIPSALMKPTLIPGDQVFVEKWPFVFESEPELNRGDIVLYSLTLSADQSASTDYLKRIIGLPGDTVAIDRGRVILNGTRLAHRPIPEESCFTEESPSKFYGICLDPRSAPSRKVEKIPKDSVFVLGDFRTRLDPKTYKKEWGIIPKSSIKGKAKWIWLSIDPSMTSAPIRLFSWPVMIRKNRLFRKID